jgi:hypothetical protein
MRLDLQGYDVHVGLGDLSMTTASLPRLPSLRAAHLAWLKLEPGVMGSWKGLTQLSMSNVLLTTPGVGPATGQHQPSALRAFLVELAKLTQLQVGGGALAHVLSVLFWGLPEGADSHRLATQRNQVNPTAGGPRQSLTSYTPDTPIPGGAQCPDRKAWELNPHTSLVCYIDSQRSANMHTRPVVTGRPDKGVKSSCNNARVLVAQKGSVLCMRMCVSFGV